MKKALEDLLSSAFDVADWQDFLASCFDLTSLKQNAELRTIAANNFGITNCDLLGEFFTTDKKQIGFYYVEIPSQCNLEKNRVGLRNLLKKFWRNIDDGTLIVFNQKETGKWRFSYVSDTKSGGTTASKRYTYLLGTGEHVKTAVARFKALLDKNKHISLADLAEAFSVEPLTKAFYTELFDWYQWALQKVRFPKQKNETGESLEIALIRFITRMLFVWFLKEKGLITKQLFEKKEMQECLTSLDETESTYYKAILQNLFFATLNTEIAERGFRNNTNGKDQNHHYLIHTKYRYKSNFKNPAYAVETFFKNMPFINGGLFECLDYKDDTDNEIRNDFFSDKPEKQPVFPNELFWSQNENGFIDILKKYNFTVSENTPQDIQIALDPELLGRVFEELLASYNPETKESARKATGSFYTPRPIVEYMVDESIRQYLQTTTELDDVKIGTLFNEGSQDTEAQSIELTLDEVKNVIEKLSTMKILDPACGSGAFPMGIVSRVFRLLQLLVGIYAQHAEKIKLQNNIQILQNQSIYYEPDSDFKIKCTYFGNYYFDIYINDEYTGKLKVDDMSIFVKQKINQYNAQKKRKTIANIFSQGRIEKNASFNALRTQKNVTRLIDTDNNILWEWQSYNVENKTRAYRSAAVEEQINAINFGLNENTSQKTNFLIKLRIIENCIFGVDIQSIAIQISKLRAFLTLLVDETVDETKENRGVEPLPNLEFNFIAANSLIGLKKNDISKDDSGDLFGDEIQTIKKQLAENRHKNFSAKTYTEKKELRQANKELRKKLLHALHENNTYKREDASLITQWDPYSQNNSAPFFDSEWMFGIQDGFDVVLGNPPYGAKITEKDKKYFKEHYISAKTISGVQKGSTDTFCIFIENGYNSLKINGNLIFIVPMSVTSSDSMTGLHKLLEENCEMIKISSYSVRPQQIFENAVIDTAILQFIKTHTKCKKLFSTKMYRKSKKTDLRFLLENLKFINVNGLQLIGRIPKISLICEKIILQRLFLNKKIIDFVGNSGFPIFYRTSGGRYFKVITNYSTGSSKENLRYFCKKYVNVVGALLSSSLFFWYYQIFSNNHDLKQYEIESFPIPDLTKLSDSQIKTIEQTYTEYLADIEKNANVRQTKAYANIDSFKEYKIGKSKHLIDKIDDLVCPLYGLTQEETEFIKNYEIEYRLGEE